MPEIAYINERDTASFVCPDCGTTGNASVTKFKLLDQLIRLRCKCPCGTIYATTLDRRKNFRKEVDFRGRYEYSEQEEQGTITVENISVGGLKFRLGIKGNFSAGHRLWVEFRLDDGQQSLIRREVEVRWMKDLTVGAQFVNMDQYDDLGYYVLS